MANRQLSVYDALAIESHCQHLIETTDSKPDVDHHVAKIRGILSKLLVPDNNYNDGRLTAKHRIQSLQREKERTRPENGATVRARVRARDYANTKLVHCPKCTSAAGREVRHRRPVCRA